MEVRGSRISATGSDQLAILWKLNKKRITDSNISSRSLACVSAPRDYLHKRLCFCIQDPPSQRIDCTAYGQKDEACARQREPFRRSTATLFVVLHTFSGKSIFAVFIEADAAETSTSTTTKALPLKLIGCKCSHQADVSGTSRTLLTPSPRRRGRHRDQHRKIDAPRFSPQAIFHQQSRTETYRILTGTHLVSHKHLGLYTRPAVLFTACS